MGKTRVLPYIDSLTLCDEVHHSGNTAGMPDGVYDLVGVRTTLQIPAGASFPYRHPSLNLFLRLSGPVGFVTCRVAFSQEEEEVALWEGNAEGPVELWGFDRYSPYVVALVDFEFPRAGVYCFRVRLGKGPAEEVRLLVE